MVYRAAIVAAVSVLVLGPGSPSLAGPVRTATQAGVTETILPDSSIYEPYMAVDPAGQHVFVATSEQTSTIYVLDFNGSLVKTITGEQGASGMAVDTATHTLYVADYDANAIAEIDTQTLTETARFSTSPYAGAFELAIAGGKLWFSTATQGQSVTASANLDGSNITNAGFGGVKLLASSTDGNLLAMGDHESEPPNVDVYNVSGDTPTPVSHVYNPGGNSAYVDDVAFDQSGDNVLLAAAAPGDLQQLSTSDLSSSFDYPTGGSPTAVAASADGNYIAASTAGGNEPHDLFVFRPGDATPVNSWALGNGNIIVGHCLAFSADGTRLFALAKADNTNLALETIDDPALAATTTSLSPPSAEVTYGKSVTLTAHVTGTTSGSVELDAATGGGSPSPIGFAPVDGSGDAQFTVTPTEATVYTAALKAGSGYGGSTSSGTTVSVDPLVAVSVHTRSPHRAHRRTKVFLTGTITPAPSGEALIFTVERRRRDGTWAVTASIPALVGQSGKAHTTFGISRKGSYRAQATYKGDAKYGMSHSGRWAKFSIR